MLETADQAGDGRLAAIAKKSEPPLVAHVIFNLSIGGLENGLVNLINHMPPDVFRHAIICIRGATGFLLRLKRDDVAVITLGQEPGFDPASYLRCWKLFRQLRPAIVHTRNLAALEMLLPAMLAGVQARVHSEHGRDGYDLAGNYARYNRMRKAFRPLVHRYIGMSKDLRAWLIGTIGVPPEKADQIYNGVDTERFVPRAVGGRVPFGPPGFITGDEFVVGAVGRMVPIKDHETLVRAFAHLQTLARNGAADTRLVIIGGGECRAKCEALAVQLGVASKCWFDGDRDDVHRLVPQFDVLCLTSLNEGINNTILEGMACGLPVVATAVGGNLELVQDSLTGMLVSARQPEALAAALVRYAENERLRHEHGSHGRARAERQFSIPKMVERYATLYNSVLLSRGALPRQRTNLQA